MTGSERCLSIIMVDRYPDRPRPTYYRCTGNTGHSGRHRGCPISELGADLGVQEDLGEVEIAEDQPSWPDCQAMNRLLSSPAEGGHVQDPNQMMFETQEKQ